MSWIEHLVRLGLSRNEAKALDALVSLGPAGASDVHRYAKIPRNKAYEALESLSGKGMVEVQNGRPTLYRSVNAQAIVGSLVEGYGNEAKAALSRLEKKQDELRGRDADPGSASAWVVKGEQGIQKRLSELIYDAKSDIFCISGFPPKYLLAAKTSLKAAAKRGVNTRAVCMIRPSAEVGEISPEDGSVIEFRTVKTSQTLKARIQPYDEKLVSSFAGMSGYGGMVITDEKVAFDIVDEGDPEDVKGIVFRAPGIPRIQKATVERILGLYTRKL